MSKHYNIDRLLEMSCYLIDLLPEQVPAGSTGQYFAVEEYFRRGKVLKRFGRKITSILLKLNCYYDFQVGYKNRWERNPDPEKLAGSIEDCIQDKVDCINIFVGGENTMIVISGGELYICVYNPDHRMRELLCQLSTSEGLFFRDSSTDSRI